MWDAIIRGEIHTRPLCNDESRVDLSAVFSPHLAWWRLIAVESPHMRQQSSHNRAARCTSQGPVIFG